MPQSFYNPSQHNNHQSQSRRSPKSTPNYGRKPKNKRRTPTQFGR